jgi:galactokinase
MSGAGWGGVMLALVDQRTIDRVSAALHEAGATRVLSSAVPATA